MKLSLPQKNSCISEVPPPPLLSNANVLYCKFFKNLTQFWTKLRVLALCFLDFMKNSNISIYQPGKVYWLKTFNWVSVDRLYKIINLGMGIIHKSSRFTLFVC